MSEFIDGFVFPIPKKHLGEYKQVAEKVAKIWKEHGALAYYEYAGENAKLEGTRSFAEMVKAEKDEVVVFGWTVFESRQIRDLAIKRVSSDPRMKNLIAPLLDPSRLIFDAERMVYGGFNPLVISGFE
ncbi:DUF1428 domain-containing protein [Algoriphagus mannitolivorans]|uniref:DUF1428 domain-containing protein n=1 Tax=Algoriphagus mannitolivorans TaxID=226504 RepID=UPI000408989C|nr:DUF1428 family protein [Algoriphagus mannitolivorans]